MNWLLILVVAILAVFTIHGYHRGFIRKIFSLFSIVIATLLVMEVLPYVSSYMEKTPAYETIKSNYVENLRNNTDTELEEKDQIAELLGIPFVIAGNLFGEEIKGAEEKVVEEIYDVIGSKMADVTIKVISFIIVFLVIMIIMNIIIFALDLVAKLPVIKGLNKIAGLFAGAFEGFLVVWFCLLFITFFEGSQTGIMLHQLIKEDVFLSFLYHNNYVLKFITGMGIL